MCVRERASACRSADHRHRHRAARPVAMRAMRRHGALFRPLPQLHATSCAVCAACAPCATQRTAWYVRCAPRRTPPHAQSAPRARRVRYTTHRLVCAVRPATCAAMRAVCVLRCACTPHARSTAWYVRCAPPRARSLPRCACTPHARSTVWYVRCAPPRAPPCAQSACRAVCARHTPHRLVCAVRPCIARRHTRTV